MHPSGQAVGRLWIEGAEAGEAAERRLDVAARAAEAVVQVEMAERGIEVVAPHQADHAAAEPDAFRIAGRAVDGLRGLGEFIDLALVVPGGVLGAAAPCFDCSWVRKSPLWASADPLPRTMAASVIAAQAVRRPKEVKATRRMKFPNFLTAKPEARTLPVDAAQIGPECGDWRNAAIRFK